MSASPRPWSTNSWAKLNEDGGQRDRAEVDLGEDVSQDREDDQLDELAAPCVDERPRQSAGDSLLERALLSAMVGRHPLIIRYGPVFRAYLVDL